MTPVVQKPGQCSLPLFLYIQSEFSLQQKEYL